MAKEYYYTPSEFAETFRYHVNSVYRWIHEGYIKARKIKIYQRFRYLIPTTEYPPVLKPGPSGAKHVIS